jgi:competence CoiA-like predicted nuclease
MYTARHQPSGEEITILDPRWMAQLEYLRVLDKQDALVCPGCQQAVRVRAGQFKRWHFAHKHLHNCPFERESPRLLQSRAVLYDWLVGKFGVEAVRVEKKLESPSLSRHFDCWVELGDRRFAYWIFDRRMPPDERLNLKSACDRIGLDVQWVFVVDLLHADDHTHFSRDRQSRHSRSWDRLSRDQRSRLQQNRLQTSRLHLTTTERTFMRQSAFDTIGNCYSARISDPGYKQAGGSLHYINPDREILTTYRNLILVHEPQLYAGKRLQTPLAEVQVSNSTGEFVHPGELEQLQQRQSEIAEQQRQAEERLQRAKDFLKGASLTPRSATTQKASPAPNPFERQATCKICGRLTSDWVTYFGQTKECICRDCNATADKRGWTQIE